MPGSSAAGQPTRAPQASLASIIVASGLSTHMPSPDWNTVAAMRSDSSACLLGVMSVVMPHSAYTSPLRASGILVVRKTLPNRRSSAS